MRHDMRNIVIKLSWDEDAALIKLARQQGVPLKDYIRSVLQASIAQGASTVTEEAWDERTIEEQLETLLDQPAMVVIAVLGLSGRVYGRLIRTDVDRYGLIGFEKGSLTWREHQVSEVRLPTGDSPAVVVLR